MSPTVTETQAELSTEVGGLSLGPRHAVRSQDNFGPNRYLVCRLLSCLAAWPCVQTPSGSVWRYCRLVANVKVPLGVRYQGWHRLQITREAVLGLFPGANGPERIH